MRSDIFKSATIQLTLWYMAIVIAISLGFSVAVYHFATNELAVGLDTQSRRFYQTFPVLYDNPLFRRNNDLTNGRRHILFTLAEFNLVVFVAAGFASYWLAQRTLRPIEEANERQKRFVADASHELRTPLTSLKMSTEVALMDKKASRQALHDALQSNLEETNKLDALLNTLLKLSQLEINDIRHKFTNLSTGELAKIAIKQVAAQAQAKRITLTNDVLDHPVTGEADSLTQALVILLDNAIKYSPEESSIALGSSSSPEATSITIQDRGVGIEPAALAHVFDRFYRANKARSRENNDGFGLGLSIAKHIADLHHGTITLRSTVGKGTTATLTLPNHTPNS
jgi:signal transduction histidine kinase